MLGAAEGEADADGEAEATAMALAAVEGVLEAMGETGDPPQADNNKAPAKRTTERRTAKLLDMIRSVFGRWNMRSVTIALIVILGMIVLGVLLGSQSPAPALPDELLDTFAWVDRAEQLSQAHRFMFVLNLALTPLALRFFVQSG